MKTIAASIITIALLSGCTTYKVHRNDATPYAATQAGSVQILYSKPDRPHQSIGIVSAKKYRPGWTDPTVADAIPQLQAAGAEIGADAIIVMQSRSANDRHVIVEGEAIKFIPGQNSQENPAPEHQQMQWEYRGIR